MQLCRRVEKSMKLNVSRFGEEVRCIRVRSVFKLAWSVYSDSLINYNPWDLQSIGQTLSKSRQQNGPTCKPSAQHQYSIRSTSDVSKPRSHPGNQLNTRRWSNACDAGPALYRPGINVWWFLGWMADTPCTKKASPHVWRPRTQLTGTCTITLNTSSIISSPLKLEFRSYINNGDW